MAEKETTKRTIEVVSYNSSWPELFQKEAELIKKALGNNCIAIHHIGSTSIPGLSAKPIIDILPVVRDILEVDKVTKAMEDLGYEAKGEFGIAFRRYFQKSKNIRTHHVHVYEVGDSEINRYLRFRDWMRSHDDDAQNYAKLKLELAAKFPHDIVQYCSGKDAFVASIDAKDGFEGHRIVKALTNQEWEAVHALRQKFFKLKSDPFSWTFDHKEHIHFVFYKNAKIIGYAHLHLESADSAVLRMIIIEEQFRNLGHGRLLMGLCERWLSHQNIKKLTLRSPLEAYKFFHLLGYSQMFLKDSDGYKVNPEDIAMVKILTENKSKSL